VDAGDEDVAEEGERCVCRLQSSCEGCVCQTGRCGWETTVVAEASLTLVAVARLVQTDVVAALAPLAEVSGKMLRW